jgi:hypothetical protein
MISRGEVLSSGLIPNLPPSSITLSNAFSG